MTRKAGAPERRPHPTQRRPAPMVLAANRLSAARLAALLDQLHPLYTQLHAGEELWAEELDALRLILPALANALPVHYLLRDALGVGGVGIVLQAHDTNLNVPRALKFPRPRAGQIGIFGTILVDEISRVREANHPNVIEIFHRGELRASGYEVPYYVMQFVPGGLDALNYFTEPRDAHSVVQVLGQLIAGLEHLHTIGMVHLDLKWENVLVGADGRTVISDLGSARRLADDANTTRIFITPDFAHPDLLARISAGTTSGTRRVPADVHRSDLRRTFDLYALGKNLFRLLDHIYEPSQHKQIDPFTRKYVKLMAARLLDGHNVDSSELPLGLPRSAFQELRYTSIAEAARDLRKLTGEYPLTRLLPELDRHAVTTIQSSGLSQTPYTDRVARLVEHPAFHRISGVSQLGLVRLVYPTATHSRAEHSLGTFTNVVRYCDALYHDPINPLFRQIMTEEDITAAFLAALCHDLGQYAMAHDLEEVDKEIFDHERVATELLIGSATQPDTAGLRALIATDWGVAPERVASILRADPNDDSQPIKERILHTLIDSPIDADKLDYLVRDSTHLNVTFGRAIDFDRLLQQLTVVFRPKARGLHVALGIHEKGKVPAETVAFVRYAMFGAVYWHHSSRAAKAMLHRAVAERLPHTPAGRRRYRAELVDFVLGPHPRPELFPEQTLDPLPSTQILPADRAMIAWLCTRTSAAGNELLKMILKRDLYKRLLVLSPQKSAETEKLWTKLREYTTATGAAGIVRLEDELSRRLRERLEEVVRQQPDMAAAFGPVAQLCARGLPLVLVDVPGARAGSTIPLEYLPETDRRSMLDEWREPTELEDSVIWTALHKSFIESVGKCRLFCHPDVRAIVEIAKIQPEIEEHLSNAIQAARRAL